ncbi:MAG: transaldolase family protein [Helicobacter sp.]|nr:transaldolase family protein [Helicobacter sp.]
MNSLVKLSKLSKIVADTGDIKQIWDLRDVIIDATTNPSLITNALTKQSDNDEFQSFYEELLKHALEVNINDAPDLIAIHMGAEILSIIKGRVSSELDPNLAHDESATIKEAHKFIERYAKLGIKSERILIKIPATNEGIAAAKKLQKDGIYCNLTLLFTHDKAKACADAGVSLISPFVGRISDFYKDKMNFELGSPDDPGIKSVKNIYSFYKNNGYKTEVMAASFRSIRQVCALGGCDLLTISPALIHELKNADITPNKLDIAPQKLENQNQLELETLVEAGIAAFSKARSDLKAKLAS